VVDFLIPLSLCILLIHLSCNKYIFDSSRDIFYFTLFNFQSAIRNTLELLNNDIYTYCFVFY
jgi:hypothetical protein